MKKQLIISISATICAVSMLICTLSGCNSKTDESTDTKKSSSVSESSKSEKSSDKTIDFSKLDWKVEEEIIDGKRLPIFSYTNNTDVTICDFVLVFKQKETTTRQDLSVFKEATDALEISGDALDKLDFTASCKLFTKPGETNGNDTIAIDNRIGYRVTDMKQYALMEPDYATIAFLDGGYIYGMNYDFKNEKSTPVKKAVEAYNWTDSELGKAIPKLECEVTRIGMDDEETFSVTGYDFSEEMREAYINACIDMGYKTDDKLTDTYVDFYKGKYEVDVDYYEKNKELQIRVEKLTESELKEAESSRQESSKLS